MCGIVDVSCFVKMISSKACGCLDYSQIVLKNMITTSAGIIIICATCPL